jgi:glutamine amidotransferase
MLVAVVDYGSGNLASASRALAVAADRMGLEVTVVVTSEAAVVDRADRVVLPGQGAFADCAEGLHALPGMWGALAASRAPFLGICVGMQLMAERGLEHRVTPGFGWLHGEIGLLGGDLRLPQMGWNALDFVPGSHPLLDGLAPGAHGYFVHSYALQDGAPAETIATTEYGGAVPAIVAAGHRAGTQFHVEKSQEVGLRILANFLTWSPA